MYRDSAQITTELLDEAMGLRGMIDEVLIKCRILHSKSTQERQIHAEPSPQFQKEAVDAIAQMQTDLARYQQRLGQIYEELESYGVVPEVQ